MDGKDIKVKDILRICDANLAFGDEEIVCQNFSKDTRTINENDVYVGIKGENFDGNSLYVQAFEKGAMVCIVQGVEVDDTVKAKYGDRCLIIVKDTIVALQKIASYKRELYDIPVIAVTGSVGKTSTKDIISSVVSTSYNVLKTQGNLNNHIGVPMTILGLKDHNALVVEMGMNNLGEISVLSEIAKPNIAVITNVGTSHIGNLGSRENILKAKLEILDGLKDNGVLIINNDNDLLHKWSSEWQDKWSNACLDNNPGMCSREQSECKDENNCRDSKNLNIRTYGIENISDVIAKDIVLNENSSTFTVQFKDNNIIEKVNVPIGGLHFVYNALCAIMVGKVLNIPMEKISEGIQNFELSKNRMELINIPNNIVLINDCYNANYDSMKAGIEYLAKTKAQRKIAVLGDMLELGEFSEKLHTEVGNEVLKNKIDVLITVGKMAENIANIVKISNPNVYICKNNSEATEKIKSIMHENDIILIKASNGMKFKEIVDELKK